jgi:hypothetical protein
MKNNLQILISFNLHASKQSCKGRKGRFVNLHHKEGNRFASGKEIGINFVRCLYLTRCIREREVNMLKILVKEGPIFLLCVNYKIIAKIMGEIMKRVMHKVVLDDQIGFIPI